jgi:hypothetical protein
MTKRALITGITGQDGSYLVVVFSELAGLLNCSRHAPATGARPPVLPTHQRRRCRHRRRNADCGRPLRGVRPSLTLIEHDVQTIAQVPLL